MKKEIPFWEKSNLTIEEAAVHFAIGTIDNVHIVLHQALELAVNAVAVGLLLFLICGKIISKIISMMRREASECL